MFWKNTSRVTNACKGVLDCLWIKLRIENAANRGAYLGVVTAMGAAVHRPSLFGDRLAEDEDTSVEAGTATIPVAPLPLGRCPPGHSREQRVEGRAQK
jgi:hypothetical protein